MERPPDTTHTLTTKDLHTLHRTVVQDLLRGHGFIILYAGRPFAHLLPLDPAPTFPPPELPQQVTHRLARLEALLGQTDLARVLGLTLTTFLAHRPDLRFSRPTIDRLAALTGVIDELEAALPAARIRAWFVRASKELKGVSVLSALAFPWNPGDKTITLVEHLARRERVRHLTSPAPSPCRRRP